MVQNISLYIYRTRFRENFNIRFCVSFKEQLRIIIIRCINIIWTILTVIYIYLSRFNDKNRLPFYKISRGFLDLKSSFWRRPMLESSPKTCRIGRWMMHPFVTSMSDEGWRRWSTEERRHHVVPRLIHYMRTITHAKRLIEPRAISVVMRPWAVQVATSANVAVWMLLILILIGGTQWS